MAGEIRERARLPTLTEFVEAYHRRPSEVVAGEITPMLNPGRLQARIGRLLFTSLNPYVERHQLGEVYVRIPYVILDEEHDNRVRAARLPQVSYITRVQVLAHDLKHPNPEDPWCLAPELVVEVVSTADMYSDFYRKIDDHLAHGVKLLWVVDPFARSVHIRTMNNPLGHILDETATLDGGEVLPGWSMAVHDILDVPGVDASQSAEQ